MDALFRTVPLNIDYLENFDIPELQVGLLSPNQDPFLPPFPHSPLPELYMPSCSPKSTLTSFSLIPPYSPGDPNLSFEDLFETGSLSPNIPSPPPMNPIFQPVQEPDIKISNKEMPASILPSISSSEVESQFQQISAEKPLSSASKTVEDTTLDPSTIPNLMSLALRPLFSSTTTSYTDNPSFLSTSPTAPSTPQSLVTQIT